MAYDAPLYLYYLQLEDSYEALCSFLLHYSVGPFPDFIQMAQNFDDCRRKWLSSEQELGSFKEMLIKAEMEKGALEVKLKHARNQVDVEIRRRQKAETDCDTLVCSIKCQPFHICLLCF